jgi:hypothetical protein
MKRAPILIAAAALLAIFFNWGYHQLIALAERGPVTAVSTPEGMRDRVTRWYAVPQIGTVVLQTSDAALVRREPDTGVTRIRVSGITRCTQPGFHVMRRDATSNRRLDFTAERCGDILTISTVNEVRDTAGHADVFDSIEVSLPPGVRLVVEKRPLSSDGSPRFDLPDGIVPSPLQ